MLHHKLSGVPETLLIPLWARATETQRPCGILTDEAAVEIVSRIDYDFDQFQTSWKTQVGVAIRSVLLDAGVEDFLTRNPDGVIVNLGAGLDTRYTRVSPTWSRWYDLDLPDVIELRERLCPDCERHASLAYSVLDPAWMDEVEDEGEPVLMIAEELLMYFEEAELRPLFARTAQRFPGGEMLVEMVAPMMVGRARMHDSASKVEEGVEFRWGPADTRRICRYSPAIEFVEEWNYFDYHQERWGWLGRIGRLPLLRSRMACRIAHLRIAPSADGGRG
jgi:O-methyltransferase involved in polyketide biosynthesis